LTGRQSNNQRGLTVLRIQQLFKDYADRAGLPATVASRSLRHSIARALAGGSLRRSSAVAGMRRLEGSKRAATWWPGGGCISKLLTDWHGADKVGTTCSPSDLPFTARAGLFFRGFSCL
jgi:hypothetical protein